MAESVVSFLLQKLSSLLNDEVKVVSGFRDEVFFVKDELDRMRAFLRLADAMEDEDDEIKVWVKQVREVAYDAEDIIDDFLYTFEHRQYLPPGPQPPRRRGLCGYLCKMARRIKNLKARHRIASPMQSIKLRVTGISEGRQRYGCKLSSTEIGSSSETKPCYFSELRNDAQLLGEAQLVGIESQKQDLSSFLVEDTSELQVAVVVGMGGLGKTTLVSAVCNGTQVMDHFKNQAWITVSKSFKLDELLWQIIKQLYKAFNKTFYDEGEKSTDTTYLKRTIANFLRTKKYLLILDDIWDVDAWKAIQLAFQNNNNGSRLMITTRIEDVASSITNDLGGRIFHLNHLSPEDSSILFRAKAFQGNQCPPQLKKISKGILKRCEGLPLAIVAIGSMLATKDINKVDEWEIVHRSLSAELQGNTKLKSMQAILSLSFNDLPYNLKYCFMYLGIFPEDYLINRNALLRLWIAEGFIEKIEGRSLEEVANGCFNELLNRSLVLGLRLVKVLDCTWAPVTTFPHDITKLYHLRYLCFRDTAVSSIPPSIANLRHLETLDLKNTLVRELPREILQLQCLRHVIVYDYKRSSHIGMLRGFKALEGIDFLSSLRKLCYVEAKSGGTELLGSIGKLTQLTKLGILQLGAEHENALWSSIHELKLLRSLRLVSRTGDRALLVKVKSFSSLRFLQRLRIVGRIVNSLEGLRKLTNLSQIYLVGSKLQVDPLESLQALPNLVSLYFHEQAYEGLSLCFKAGGFLMLKKLYIVTASHLTRVTVEDTALSHLELMYLDNCKKLEEVPSGIERLTNLQHLHLIDLAVELTATIYRGNQHDNYFRVMHIPSVYIGQMNELGFDVGHWL